MEIGPGHGHLLVTAMERSGFNAFTAVDISQSSVDTAAAYVNFCLPGKTNWQILRKDFFEFESSEKFDGIVMGEVLEHVEEPERFLKKARGLAADGAFIYVATAVNTPCFDHIYHFGTTGEVEEIFARCGFAVSDKVYAAAGGVSFEKAVNRKYSIVPAYVLKKI